MNPTSHNSIKSKKGRAVHWPVDGLDGVECLRATAIRHTYGRHWHDAYAVGIIEAGVGGNYCRGTDHFNRAGSIVVMNPGETHTGYCAGREPLSYRMFYISPRTMLDALPEKTAPPRFNTICMTDGHWARKLRHLHHCLESRADPLEKQTRFNQIIGGFTAIHTHVSIFAGQGREPAAVRQVITYLRDNYTQPATIDDLARLTQLNRAYLIRTFTRTVGMPPYAYLTQVRVEEAKKLIASNMPLAQVALEVGFADQSHLNRHFKRLTGTTPGLYRQSHYRTRLSA